MGLRKQSKSSSLVLEFAQNDVLVEGNAVHAHIESRAEQENARQLAVNGVDLLGWRTQSMSHHCGHQGGQPLGGVLLAKIEVPVVAEDLAQNHHGVHVGLLHLLGLVAGEEAHFAGHLQNALPVVLGGAHDNLPIVPDELVPVEARRAEIDQHKPATGRIVQKVGPIRIRLHALDLEELSQAELQHGGGYVGTMLVAGRD